MENKNIDTKIGLLIIAGMVLASGAAIFSANQQVIGQAPLFSINWPKISLPHIEIPFIISPSEPKNIKKFSSEEDFKDYLNKSALAEQFGFGSDMGMGGGEIGTSKEMAPAADGNWLPAPDRISQTNVQVVGIDEPDIVKTDGKTIYFSPQNNWRIFGEPMPAAPLMVESKTAMPYDYEEPNIKVINGFPPVDLKTLAEIDKSGDLLLTGNVLIIFNDNREIAGYDVTDPSQPKKIWETKTGENTFLVSSRLYREKIYLVLATSINSGRPCPITLLTANGAETIIRCPDIYHPLAIVPTDATFTAIVLDPKTGKEDKKVSFVGSLASSVVYMSENSLYFAYAYRASVVDFIGRFFSENGKGLLPEAVVGKIKKLIGYDISEQAKMIELQVILEKYQNSLTADERLKLENEIANKISDYYKNHVRELEKTGIVKINLSDFNLESQAEIPGRLLNQFSLDEYENNLRAAVTIGERWGVFNGIGAGQTANDVYVLNKDLKVIGEVKDLGLGERIYSARFIEDKGYLVTFRETDPFYVLDLSNPKNPQLKGELKIPGYSGYLHPLKSGLILGIGRENWQVKISLFDVSSDKEPKETAKYILNDSWSDVLNNHHGFLADAKHQIFFIPGSNGGYIFSYKNNQLEMVKAVSGISARRAIYLGDYLYVIGDDKIRVFNENDWQEVNSLDLY